MKSKNFDKKLVLGKTTVVDLNNGQMVEIHGGEKPPTPITYSRCFTVCGGANC